MSREQTPIAVKQARDLNKEFAQRGAERMKLIGEHMQALGQFQQERANLMKALAVAAVEGGVDSLNPDEIFNAADNLARIELRKRWTEANAMLTELQPEGGVSSTLGWIARFAGVELTVPIEPLPPALPAAPKLVTD